MQSDAEALDALLDAALGHVIFDGWGPATFRAAIAESGVAEDTATRLCPRGAIDLAVAYHRRGDAAMTARLGAADLKAMRIRDRITFAVMTRLEVVGDREIARKGAALFGLPHHAPEGAALIWSTADAIWTALGDPSRDINWYSKRATLSAVYGATVLYWLGDTGADHQATREFLDRRIENVMQIERVKGTIRENAFLSKVLAGPFSILDKVRAPGGRAPEDLPGHWPDHRP